MVMRLKGISILFLLILLFANAQSQTPPGKKKVPSIKEAIKEGEVVYTQYCLSCHQADGGGVPDMNPTLVKTSYVQGDAKTLISVVLKGLSQQDIDGVSYNGLMPPFDFLTDKEIAQVLTYVRNSFGNKGKMILEEEVKAARVK